MYRKLAIAKLRIYEQSIAKQKQMVVNAEARSIEYVIETPIRKACCTTKWLIQILISHTSMKGTMLSPYILGIHPLHLVFLCM